MPVATITELSPLALPPAGAAAFLSISKRSLSRLIADGKIAARKDGPRTLVDVGSLRAYYASLPLKAGAEPLPCSTTASRRARAGEGRMSDIIHHSKR